MDHDRIGPDLARALTHRVALAQRDGRVPSVVAAVARRGEPMWFGSVGTLDGLVDGAAPTAQTQYRIGSITKTMVAVLVLRLVQCGELGLHDPLGDHLPGAPAGDSTIFQLLSHTAGLASETPPPWWERTSGAPRPGLADVLTADPRRHPAGERFHYSNPGFGLLGELVSHRTGRPWFDVLAADVLTPLGMTRTSYQPKAPHAAGWATHPWADVVLPEPFNDHGRLAGAGQLWSTPEDLCRFAVFLGSDVLGSDVIGSDVHDGDGAAVLSRELLTLMRTPVTGPEGEDWSGAYGLGVQFLRFGSRIAFGHTGSMPGFVATAVTSPEDGLTVAVQANAWGSLALGALTGELLALVAEREPTLPTPWTRAPAVDPAAFELVGPWYWGAVPMSITLRADGELDLRGLGGRGRAARFVELGDGRWRGRNGYYDGEFLVPQRDATGAITHLDLGSFVFTRAPYAPGGVVPGGLELGDWQS